MNTFSILVEPKEKPLPLGTVIKNLFLNPTYLLSVMAITIVNFVLTAMQYWFTSYSMNVLNMDQDTIVVSFSVAVLSAPVLGALVGGLYTTKYLGSYTNKKALGLCFFVYCLFVAFCIPCPMVDNYWAFLGLIWFAVFMQGFIEPIMMGIILNTVTPIERPSASSLLILIEFMLGLLPAPYLYGVA